MPDRRVLIRVTLKGCIIIHFPYHVLISNATINNSLKINAVNDIDTIWINSSSNKRIDRIMIAPPATLGEHTIHKLSIDTLKLGYPP
jgi:hypothetical protein